MAKIYESYLYYPNRNINQIGSTIGHWHVQNQTSLPSSGEGRQFQNFG